MNTAAQIPMMLRIWGGKNDLSAAKNKADTQDTVPLGRWKLAGENCDGKCLAGAMRPGRGLAHEARANLCLLGSVPPVFVSSRAVDGSEFMLVAGLDGSSMPIAAFHYIDQFISIEGDVERRGDVLVPRIDPAKLKVLY